MAMFPLTLVQEQADCSNLLVEMIVEGAMSLLSYQRALLGVQQPAWAVNVARGL